MSRRFCVISAAVFFLFGVHRGVWRFASLSDLRNIVLASTTSMLVFLLAMFLVDRLAAIPRSVPLIAWFMMIVLLSAPRVAYRHLDGPAAAGRGAGPGC